MNERQHIVELWRQGSASALITLVRAEGSSYRRPGARLLLDRLNRSAGTISGGCLEAEMIRRAPWLIQQGAKIERISTKFDDTAEIPFGLGCGGTLDLLLEPAETAECQALMGALEQSLSGEKRTVVTWLPDGGSPLARAVVDVEGALLFASAYLSDSMRAEALALARSPALATPAGVFAERLEGPQRLVVVGAGEDAKPLVKMAALLGWNVTVADGRAHLARSDRFPEAQRVVLVDLDDFFASNIRQSDAVVVMSHSYDQDREALTALLPLRPKYLGLLGARHRSSLLLSEAAAKLGWSVAHCCEQVYAPIGLDLGGDGPEAIALAVIAEVQACCMDKPSGSLRLSAHDVDAYLRDGTAATFTPTSCALEIA